MALILPLILLYTYQRNLPLRTVQEEPKKDKEMVLAKFPNVISNTTPNCTLYIVAYRPFHLRSRLRTVQRLKKGKEMVLVNLLNAISTNTFHTFNSEIQKTR